MVEGDAAARGRVSALVLARAFDINASLEGVLAHYLAQVMYETEECVRYIPRQGVGNRDVGRIRYASEAKAGKQHLRIGGQIPLPNIDSCGRASDSICILHVVVVLALAHA